MYLLRAATCSWRSTSAGLSYVAASRQRKQFWSAPAASSGALAAARREPPLPCRSRSQVARVPTIGRRSRSLTFASQPSSADAKLLRLFAVEVCGAGASAELFRTTQTGTPARTITVTSMSTARMSCVFLLRRRCTTYSQPARPLPRRSDPMLPFRGARVRSAAGAAMGSRAGGWRRGERAAAVIAAGDGVGTATAASGTGNSSAASRASFHWSQPSHTPVRRRSLFRRGSNR